MSVFRPRLSPKGASFILNLSVSRLSQLDRLGILPADKDDQGRRSWTPEVIERFAKEREARRAAERAEREAEAMTAA